VFFQLFLLGFAYIFFHLTIFWYAESRLFLIFFNSFILAHVIGISLWVIPYFSPCSYRITIAMCYVCHSLYNISDILHSTFQHIMQWYHFVHSPSHSKASSLSKTISWHTPHLFILDAPVARGQLRDDHLEGGWLFRPVRREVAASPAEVEMQSFKCGLRPCGPTLEPWGKE